MGPSILSYGYQPYCADLEASNTCDIVFERRYLLIKILTKRKFPLFNKFMDSRPK